jgi:hypothetical protein
MDQEDAGGDADLSSPLLSEDANTAGAGSGMEGGDAEGGVITLHGEAVDMRYMFGNVDNGNEDASRGGGGGWGVGIGGGLRSSPSSSLSLGSIVTTNPRPPSASDRTRRAIGSFYLAARRRLHVVVSNHRRTKSGGRASSSRGDDLRRRNANIGTTGMIATSSSLYCSSETPNIVKFLIPILIFINHALFYKGQTLPMWNLSYTIDVNVSASATTVKSKAAMDVLNLPHTYSYARREENKLIETFTYMDAINKLWKGDGLGDAKELSKVAAGLLVIFSGIWPHLKLFLVVLCWFLPFRHRLGRRPGIGDDALDDVVDGDNGNGGNNIRYTRSLMSRRITGISSGGGGDGGGSSASSGPRCGLCCSDGRRHESRTMRSPFLRTLSTLGKWSLADVLVVCILIAVLHLDWTVHPDEIRNGIEEQLPVLLDYVKGKYPDAVEDCTALLKYNQGCKVGEALVIHYPACFACETLINNAYSHPDWTAGEGRDILDGITLEGGGHAQLRVMGMSGTYYFCAAVISSILLSLFVDVFDTRDRKRVEEDLLDRLDAVDDGGGPGNELELRDESNTGSPSRSDGIIPPSSPRSYMSATSSRAGDPYVRLSGGGDDGRSLRRHSYATPSPTTNCHLLKRAVLILLSVSSLPLVKYAVTLPTMQRLVFGGGPTLLHEVLGMIWEKEYSLTSLVKTTGDAGGWDKFLMLTFGLFAIVGPILRSICLLLHVLLGLPEALLGECIERPRRRTTLRLALYRATSTFRWALLPVIDALGAFCCWEVLIVALFMIQWEIPSITDTIYQDDRCREADPEHGRTCIEVQFNAMDSFLTVGVAWFVLTVGSGMAMAVAGDSDGKAHPIEQDENRYEFGQPIPRRRANLSRDSNWCGYNMVGTTEQPAGTAGSQDDGEYFSPLQHQDDVGDNGLEQIVFI